jgi:hypothetical protein
MSVGWGQNCIDGIEVELWGECYNIEETTSILLWDSGLTGEIPPEIGLLVNLTSLEIGGEGGLNLSGGIPSEIGNLTNLTILELWNCGLTGEIPPEIGLLVNLTRLVLTYNYFSGEILSEIGNLVNLEELHLSSNQFIGEIPPEIGNLTSLTDLSLGYNQLTGEIPSEIGNLSNLTELNLGHNQLGCYEYDFDGNCNASNVIECCTIHCIETEACDSEIPLDIGNLISLNSLYLHHNQLTGEIPLDIGNLINLTLLWLGSNQLTGDIPSEIGNLTDLVSLYLLGNQLSGEIPVEICDLSNLVDILLIDNQLCPPYPDCLSPQDIGPQDTSNCFNSGSECLVGDEYGYYDCYEFCVLPTYFEEWLGDGFCDDSNVSFNCPEFGYDCGDCSEEWDGTDPLGFCSCPLVTGDTNEDGVVNILDIVLVGNCVLSGNCDECSDLNYDGSVDVLDIVIMINIVLEI